MPEPFSKPCLPLLDDLVLPVGDTAERDEDPAERDEGPAERAVSLLFIALLFLFV